MAASLAENEVQDRADRILGDLRTCAIRFIEFAVRVSCILTMSRNRSGASGD